MFFIRAAEIFKLGLAFKREVWQCIGMMILEQYPVDGVAYQTLQFAQESLRREGWSEFHAGNWRNSNKRGFSRDIRKQPQGFVIYESSYHSR